MTGTVNISGEYGLIEQNDGWFLAERSDIIQDETGSWTLASNASGVVREVAPETLPDNHTNPTYDSEENGVIDDAARLGGSPPTSYASSAHDHSGGALGTEAEPVGEAHIASGNVDELYPTEVQNTIHWIPPDATATDINTIIANATDGDTIQFPNGNWTIDQPIGDNGKNNITLRGAGMYSTVLTVAGQTTMDGIFINGVSGWDISHLTVDANGANQTDSGDANTQLCIRVRNSSNVEVHHTRLKDSIYANIRAQARDGDMGTINIHDNVTGPVIGGVGGADDNISLTSSDGMTLSNWRVADNWCFDCIHQAIEISNNCDDGIVEGNIVVDCLGTPAIVAHDGNNVNVEGNIVNNCAEVGIQISSPNSAAIGNTVINAGSIGIMLGTDTEQEPNTAARGNTIRDSTGNGIEVYSHGAVVANNTVTGVPAGTGRSCIQTLDAEVTITGNYCDGGQRGIRSEAQAVGTLIVGNTATNSSEAGIFARGDDTFIVGNHCYAANRGIEVYAAAGCLIGLNVLRNNADTGIPIYSTASDIHLVDNYYSGNATDRSVAPDATQVVLNGTGYNGANDPAVGGEWNTNGFEGLRVKWDDGAGTDYLSHYLDGVWYDTQLA